METIINIAAANQLLEKYSGARAQVWAFHISHKRLALKLSLPKILNNYPETVYVIAVTCESIKGSFSWQNANLQIQECISDDLEPIIKIIDRNAGFELVALGGFTLAQGNEEEFGTSFDNFFQEKK
jgi:hypothetical protein